MSDWYSEMSTRTNKASAAKEKKVEEKSKEEPEFAGYISKIRIGNSL